MPRKTCHSLRSERWFASDELRSASRREQTIMMKYGPEVLESKPLVARSVQLRN